MLRVVNQNRRLENQAPMPFGVSNRQSVHAVMPQVLGPVLEKSRNTLVSLPTISPVRFAGHAIDNWAYGAEVVGNPGNTRFKVWAPVAKAVELLIIKPQDSTAKPQALEKRITESIPMSADGRGNYFLEKPNLPAGTLYMYRLKRENDSLSKPLPDLYSRFQPEDVHGPSEVIRLAPSTVTEPVVLDKRKASIYHLHVGTQTTEGTLDSLVGNLSYIKDMGYTHVKMMPLDEFAGKWNWGYDGVFKHAIENAYGRPKNMQRLVEEAKKLDLGVIIDVVFNHIGPEGNYFREYDPNYIEPNPPSREWGDQFNWNNPNAVDYVLKSLEMYVKEYKVSGFRFDMSSRIPDHVLKTITKRLAELNPNLMLIAEDDRTSNHVVMPPKDGGLGFWAKHNFDWHHRAKGVTTGKGHMGSPTDAWNLSWILEEGFPGPGNRMNSLHDSVNFYESHDEIGNHDGQRTSTKIPRNRFVVGSMLKYMVPGVAWTFQGEESYSQSPFYYFVNHTDPTIIQGTRNGRKYSPQPDCMRPENFTDSKIKWDKVDKGFIAMNKAMNQLRKTVPALWQGDQKEMQIDRDYLNSNVLVIRRSGRENPEDKVVIVVNMSDYHYKQNYNIRLSEIDEKKNADGGVMRRRFDGQNPKDWQGNWEEIFSSEDIAYGGNGWTNARKTFQNQGDLSLPGWSITILRKKK